MNDLRTSPASRSCPKWRREGKPGFLGTGTTGGLVKTESSV